MFRYLSSWIYGPDVDQEFQKHLTKRLTQHGINCPDLYAKLQETGSLIAGSYPLQTHLKETWSGSDLDIFTNNREMLNYFTKTYKHVSYLATGSYPKYPTTFNKVAEFTTPYGFKIQVIYSNQLKEIVKDTFDRFDLDFCKVGFDGEKLYIDNPEAIKTRACVYNYNPHSTTIKNYDRMLKYENRGFKIKNREEVIDKMIRGAEHDQTTLTALRREVRQLENHSPKISAIDRCSQQSENVTPDKTP